MNKILTLLGSGVSAVVLFASPAIAQENAPTPVIEIYGCNFKANNDMDNLLAATARWNTFADRNNVKDYTAFIATPYLHSPDLTYDALWLGGWPNGAAMGAGEALYFTKGQEVAAGFDAVADCSSHAQYAEVVIRQPQGPPPQNGVAVFSDCTVHEGRTVPEAITALTQWGEYLKGRGSDGFSALLFGLAGLEGDADFTFKYIEGFDSIQAYGKFTDVYTGGGFLKGDELFGRLLTCNSSRVYNLNRVRLAAPPQ
jgi:hypothetical protein